MNKLKGGVLLLLVLYASNIVYGQQSIFWHGDTVSFSQYTYALTADTDISKQPQIILYPWANWLLTQQTHYKSDADIAAFFRKKLDIKVKAEKRKISVSGMLVYYFENPHDSFNVEVWPPDYKKDSNDLRYQLDMSYRTTKIKKPKQPYPLFKAMVRNDTVFYVLHDTLNNKAIYRFRTQKGKYVERGNISVMIADIPTTYDSLEIANAKKVLGSTWNPPGSYNDMVTNQGIVNCDINGQVIPCYLLNWKEDDTENSELIDHYEYVEESSLLPVIEVTQIFKNYHKLNPDGSFKRSLKRLVVTYPDKR